MKQQLTINLQDLMGTLRMLSELLCLRRWSELIVTPGKFTELGKQSLNSAIAFFWATEISNSGVEVDFTKFPKLALYRGFTKTIQCDIPEANLACILEQASISEVDFRAAVIEKIENNISHDFSSNLLVDHDCLEAQIYRAATKVATLLELRGIRKLIDERDYESKEAQVLENLASHSNLPCYEQIMSAQYQEIFRNFLKLQNRIRWAKHPNIVSCSVLGHHFDTAVFAYLMSLEAKPGDEDLASKYFFLGIFHDFPESWTGDMPSPVKDSIPGLRKATESFENWVMDENVYSHLPAHMAKALRAVMLEDEDNAHLKVFLKKADSLAAYVECWREIDAGSRHYYYRDVIKNDISKSQNLPPIFCQLMKKLYSMCLSI